MSSEAVSRRNYIKYVATGAVAAAVAAAGGYYAGTTRPPPSPETYHLNYLCCTGPEPEAVADAAIPLYEKKNPKVLFTSDVAARDVFEEKLMREFVEKEGRYDIVWIWNSWGPKYGPTGGLENLDDWIKADDSAYEPFIVDALLKGGYSYEGKRLVWPNIYWNTQVVFYRKDLFEDATEKKNFKDKYGYDLRPPKTWDEFYDMTEFFNRPPDLYGHHYGGIPWNVEACILTSLAQSNGGILVDADRKVRCTETGYLEAFKFAVEMTKFNPPGWETQSFFDGEKLLKDGKLAMHLNWEYPWPDFFVEGKTKVYNQIMWSAHPKPTKGRFASKDGLHAAPLSGGGVTMPVGSKNKRAAADFIQWMDSFEAQKAMALTGALGVHCGRMDVTNDPDVKKVTNYIKADYWDEFVAVPVPDATSRVRAETDPFVSDKYIKVAHGEQNAEDALEEIKKKCEEVIATW